jgi:hydrogenase nickel incorporation protein HypA/HybF
MHEMGITQSIVSIVTEQAHGRKVRRVTLEIGKLSPIMPDAIRFCFDVLAQDSVIAGAALDIIEVPGKATCLECAAEVSLADMFGQCMCGSRRLRRIAGEELNIKSMEVEEL